MAELFEEVVSLLESRSTTRALAGQFRIESEQAAGNGAILGVPVLLATMHEWASDPDRSAALLRVLRSMDTTGLQDPGAAIEGRSHEPVGTELTTMLLGSRRGRVASVISSEAGISVASANGLLPPTAWAVLASVADRYGNRIDRQSLIAILSREHKDLVDSGWGPWLDATGEEVIPAQPEFVAQQTMGGAHSQVADPGADGNYPPPVTRSARIVDEQAVAAAAAPAAAGAAVSGRGTALSDSRAAAVNGPVNQRREAAPRVEEERLRREPPPNRMPAILGALLLFLLGAAAIYWLLSERDGAGTDGETAINTETTVDAQTDETDQEDGAAPVDADDEAVTGSDGAAGPVALDIIMDDPQGRSTSTGVAELRFDVEAGEICYNVNAEQIGSPYDGHIHVGPAGVKGGIVVDFGPVANSDIGCTQVIPAEIESILSDPSGHYVDMHDPSGDFTIRAQLSEAMPDGAGAPPEVAADALFDANSGGASTRVEAGRLVLVGEVADQETFDRLANEFVDLAGPDGLELVNELVIADGAPLPSGLISIDDAVLFGIGSDELSADRGTVIADLATVLKARPTWVGTVVGHTDSTGSEVFNLALSLRRAEAVRDELIANGVNADALLIKGAGSTDPIGDNNTAEGRAANRRTTLNVDRG